MSTTKFPNLANGPTAPPNPATSATMASNAPSLSAPVQWKYARFIRRRGDPSLANLVEFEDLSRHIRQHLADQIGDNTKNVAARTMYVHGRPGEGKSAGILLAATNAGWHIAVIPSALLAGKEEGAPVELLNDILGELVAWSIAHNVNVALLFDDFDLSIAGAQDDTGKTIHTDLLTTHIMSLCDNRHLFRNGSGANVPIFITANDATGMRESLTRDGRATHYTHAPSIEDRANIAWALLQPKTTADRELVAQVVKKNRHQRIAFWTALVLRIRALHNRKLIDRAMPDKAAIDGAYSPTVPLDPADVWEAVRQLRENRITNHLRRARSRLLG